MYVLYELGKGVSDADERFNFNFIFFINFQIQFVF